MYQRVITLILGSNMKDRDSPSSKTSASDNELSSEPIFASIEQRNKDVRASCLKIFHKHS